ncbi:ABC transporter ATP-binding protein [Desnuesiella massiliensis]|uniref:ABC transporter ATP-binding protein n=1 Tax=Desnuesiella massiliensis TaxID=1650662 RepID=UPI00093B8F79|nr:ATP-binding cassette domain-containing protein [Desnuesiella massiliensis]
MNHNILEVNNLTKYFGKRKVINEISLKVQKGDIYGFLGQNGSGKTTTIRMLLNLIHSDGGTIKIKNFDVKKDFRKAIESVGAIVETPKFYSYLSGRKNLELMANLVPNIDEDRVEQVLEMVGLLNRAKDKVKTYSLGMKQRLGVANALLNNPELIILDEPTNGLDPQGMKEIREMIVDLSKNQNITFFISTHLLHEVEQICNRVSILHQGSIVIEGEVKDLLNKDFETIEIHTKHIDRALEEVGKLHFVKSSKEFDGGIKLDIEKGYSSELNSCLVSRDIEVSYIIPQKQSLESFFIDSIKGGKQLD